MPHQNAAIGELLKNNVILPVVTLTDLAQAIPLAKALYDGGCRTLEITLRTPVALEAIRLIVDEIPNMVVGAGSVNSLQQFKAAFLHKAAFAVSPGFTKSLLSIANEIPLPYLPGVATPSECMQLQEYGYSYLKFFPAEAIGGRLLLQSLAAPLPNIQFCPTGGINLALAVNYLSLSNVFCLGGSWLTPAKFLKESAWDQIEKLAHEANKLKKLPDQSNI